MSRRSLDFEFVSAITKSWREHFLSLNEFYRVKYNYTDTIRVIVFALDQRFSESGSGVPKLLVTKG